MNLTPEEQAFFDSGGDASKLETNAPSPAPELNALERNALGNGEPTEPTTPPVAAPAPTVAPVADPMQSLQAALDNSNAQLRQLTEQIEQIKSGQPKTPTPTEAPAPDPTTDPLGNMLHQLDKVNRTVAELKANISERQTQDTQMSAFNNFKTQVVALRDEFAKTTPDFQAAFDYVRNARTEDLRAIGASDADIAKTLFQEELGLAQRAIAAQKNPAAEIYEMAKRHGYKAAALAPVATSQSKIEQLKAGVAAASPALPKTHVNEDITIESLRDAGEADLNRLVSDPAAWAKIAGKTTLPI